MSEFFQVASIRIEGNQRLDSRYIQILSGVTYTANLLALDPGDIEARLRAHPWISQATVKRNLPSEVAITLKERKPVALVVGSHGLFFIDRHQVIFVRGRYPDRLDFPVISGLAPAVDAAVAGDDHRWRARKEQVDAVLAFIRAAGRGSSALPRQNISEVNIGADGSYTLFLADRPFPIYMGHDLSRKRYYRLAKLLYLLYKKKEFPDVNLIRMDYMNEKVLVEKNRVN